MDDFPPSKLGQKKAKKISEETDKPEPKEDFDFMELLNNPIAKEILSGCKDLFKKEKTDPNMCEITIKAPSEVVLKLFKISEEK